MRLCPAGRAHCAWRGHFVAGVPVLQGSFAMVLPLVGIIVSDQREDRCTSPCPDKLKRRANARATRSGPVRQDMVSGELFEEAHVAAVELAYVGDAVLDHGYALYSHAEGEASDLFGVVGIVRGI